MSAVEPLQVDAAVDELFTRLTSAGNDRLLRVTGDPTAGKTAVLEGLGARLDAESHFRPIMINPPLNAHDAGPVVLLQIAEALVTDRTKLDGLIDPKESWETKFAQVRRWLSREANNVVLLLDEPTEWPSYDSYFGELARETWQFAFDGIQARAVVAGRIPTEFQSVSPLYLSPASDPFAVLDRLDDDLFTEAKERLLDAFGESLGNLSPLQVRLLVALVALDPEEVASPGVDSFGRAELSSRLLAAVERSGRSTLRRLWYAVAQARGAFEESLLEHLGVHQLDSLERAIFDRCLLFRRAGGLVLHETLRTFAPSTTAPESNDTHATIAGYYRDRFISSGGETDGRLLDSVEAFYHASRAGLVELETYKPFFTDQLNILGFNLSVDHGEYSKAASVFGHALEWDADNAYATHYRAFNLDRIHERPQEVECLYRRAIELRSDHAWYHSRLITFLITWSRIDEARAAWLSALDALERPSGDLPERFYLGLHLHVARILLYRGELDFAEAVVRRVPASVRRNRRFLELEARLAAFIEARDHGGFVPIPYLHPEWWTQGPRSLPATSDAKPLMRWLAAEVERVDDEVVLHAADVVLGNSRRPEAGLVRLPIGQIRGWWDSAGSPADLVPGDFVEIGFYGDEPSVDVIALRVRGEEFDWDDGLSELHPDRYMDSLAA